jgi:hypothetical protein
MRWVFALAMLGMGAAYVHAATPDKQNSPAKSSKSTTPKPSGTHVASSAKSAHAASGHTTRRRTRARAKPAPSYQLHPDPQRYQEIQKALADRGYFKGDTNGVWGDDSVDAMKRFQRDQNLTDDGKITALTLNGLGLGPKHDAAVSPVALPTPSAGTAVPPAPSSDR